MKAIRGFVLALLVAVTGTVWGQTPGASIARNNSIEVQVRSRRGEDIKALIRVELFRGNIPSMESYANSLGQKSFHGLEDGGYAIRVSAPGYHAEYQEVELNNNIARRLTLLLRREETTNQPLTPADPMVSVRWLAAPERARQEVVKSRELRDRGDFKGAMEHLEKALKIDPTFSLALNEMGLCYRRVDELKQARKSFEAAIRNDPEYLIPYLNLAEVWMQEKEYNRAGQVLAQASKAQPDRGEPFYAMAKIQYETGHLDRAEQACRLALERDTSKIPEVHILLANVYLRHGEKAKLAAELEAYLENAPEGEHAQDARATLEKIKRERGSLPKP